MSTQLTLDAWHRELSAVSDDMLPIEEATPSIRCSFVTGHDIVLEDLSLHVRAALHQFAINHPDVTHLVVNSPMNRQHHAPSKRGLWEVLAFAEMGLQGSKDIRVQIRASVNACLGYVLDEALRDWKL